MDKNIRNVSIEVKLMELQGGKRNVPAKLGGKRRGRTLGLELAFRNSGFHRTTFARFVLTHIKSISLMEVYQKSGTSRGRLELLHKLAAAESLRKAHVLRQINPRLSVKVPATRTEHGGYRACLGAV